MNGTAIPPRHHLPKVGGGRDTLQERKTFTRCFDHPCYCSLWPGGARREAFRQREWNEWDRIKNGENHHHAEGQQDPPVKAHLRLTSGMKVLH